MEKSKRRRRNGRHHHTSSFTKPKRITAQFSHTNHIRVEISGDHGGVHCKAEYLTPSQIHLCNASIPITSTSHPATHLKICNRNPCSQAQAHAGVVVVLEEEDGRRGQDRCVREASCSDTDAGLAPMSPLCVVSVSMSALCSSTP